MLKWRLRKRDKKEFWWSVQHLIVMRRSMSLNNTCLERNRWTEEEARRHVPFCTRYFKYLTKFVKDGVMIPRSCADCNSFGRMDHHLLINHKLDKSGDKYATLLNHSRDQTERFLIAPYDSNRFNYKTTKDFNFRKGKMY